MPGDRDRVGRVLRLVGVRLVDSLGDLLGELAVLPRQVGYGVGGGGAGKQPLHVELAAEPDHVHARACSSASNSASAAAQVCSGTPVHGFR